MLKLVFAVAAALAVVPTALAAKPVPSLTPAATHMLWLAEVARAKAHPRALSDASCRPGTCDLLRADGLAAARDEARRAAVPVRAVLRLGAAPLSRQDPGARRARPPRSGRSGRASTPSTRSAGTAGRAGSRAGNGSFYDAGVLARQRMAAAGFDAAAGDTWGAERALLGRAREHGRRPRERTRVHARPRFGRRQGRRLRRGHRAEHRRHEHVQAEPAELADRRRLLERGVAVRERLGAGGLRRHPRLRRRRHDAGAAPRREVQYLGHELALASATRTRRQCRARSSRRPTSRSATPRGPGRRRTAGPRRPSRTCRTSSRARSTPRARSASPSGVDRLGFAWAPQNSLGLTTADYTAQTASVLDRIAASIRDSGDVGADAACSTFCATSLDGAAFTTAWSRLRHVVAARSCRSASRRRSLPAAPRR